MAVQQQLSKETVSIFFEGKQYLQYPNESVLDTLLRYGVDVPYSCRAGACYCCLLHTDNSLLPELAQNGLRDTQKENGYFLACQCFPEREITCQLPPHDSIFSPAAVSEKTLLNPNVVRLRLQTPTPLYYHAGQFINISRPDDGVTRSYSLASLPMEDEFLELHIKRMENGQLSNWIFNQLGVGDRIDISGPSGHCYYLGAHQHSPLLLIGNGTGLAPLIGIARDALHSGHAQPIILYHGSRYPDGLYLVDQLRALENRFEHFTYIPCVSRNVVTNDSSGDEISTAAGSTTENIVNGRIQNTIENGRVEEVAFRSSRSLDGWRVYLCGLPEMVENAKMKAYLAGAELKHIYADPFKYRDLRTVSRDEKN